MERYRDINPALYFNIREKKWRLVMRKIKYYENLELVWILDDVCNSYIGIEHVLVSSFYHYAGLILDNKSYKDEYYTLLNKAELLLLSDNTFEKFIVSGIDDAIIKTYEITNRNKWLETNKNFNIKKFLINIKNNMFNNYTYGNDKKHNKHLAKKLKSIEKKITKKFKEKGIER